MEDSEPVRGPDEDITLTAEALKAMGGKAKAKGGKAMQGLS